MAVLKISLYGSKIVHNTQIKANEKLFNEWLLIADEVKKFHRYAASIIQNDTEITEKDVQGWLEHIKYANMEYKRKLFSIVQKTKEYINSCMLNHT